MTDYTDKSNEENMASAFIVSTCQMHPTSSGHLHTCSLHVRYALFCGSSAEFYIRPLHKDIGDTDSLLPLTDQFSFSGDFPVLPNDLSGLADTIECWKIEAYESYPGFVRLRGFGDMHFNWKRKKYEFHHKTERNGFANFNMEAFAADFYNSTFDRGDTSISGPAIKQTVRYGYANDVVRCMWCPRWPIEARGFLERPRDSGWPNSDTISEVVRNGCHLVYVQHFSCRDDKLQWRFSFSLAEVILLRSWTQIQQIVYHLLRFFAKRVLIQKDCPKEDEVLCTYHLKTLMLWTCEDMSPEWWNSSSVITICCNLLLKLSDWLDRKCCPNYFIPEANLFHKQWNSTILDKTERLVSEFHNTGVLCHWFINNYIQPVIVQLNTWSKMDLRLHFANCIMPLLEFWKRNESKSLETLFVCTLTCSCANSRCAMQNGGNSEMLWSLNTGHYLRCLGIFNEDLVTELPTIQKDSCFTYYDNLSLILHIEYGLQFDEISMDSSLFVEFVRAISIQPSIIRSQHHNFPKPYKLTAQSGLFQLLRAQDLMQNLTGSNSRAEFKLLSLVSKEYLRKALEYEVGSTSSGIDSAVLAYRAALHFATSEYQLAIRFCLKIHANQNSNEDKETLNAGCLLFIDDITRIVGLCLLLKKVIDNDLCYIDGRLYLDMRLSPEVFANFLIALSSERISKRLDLQHKLPDSVFPMDEYLKALRKPKYIAVMKSCHNFNTEWQNVYCRPDSFAESESTIVNPVKLKKRVIDVLMEYSLENMTSFYSTIQKDFGIQCNTAECYRALYLYKCRQYDEVKHLCDLILLESDLQSDLKESSLVNILLIPPLDSYFDTDVQALLGFHTLFYYLSHPKNTFIQAALTVETTFDQWFAWRMTRPEKGLQNCLYFHYPIKSQYFLGRHFLARYLKVRCCIDSNLPCKDALTEFYNQKANLPFEHIIRRIMVRKLRITGR